MNPPLQNKFWPIIVFWFRKWIRGGGLPDEDLGDRGFMVKWFGGEGEEGMFRGDSFFYLKF